MRSFLVLALAATGAVAQAVPALPPPAAPTAMPAAAPAPPKIPVPVPVPIAVPPKDALPIPVPLPAGTVAPKPVPKLVPSLAPAAAPVAAVPVAPVPPPTKAAPPSVPIPKVPAPLPPASRPQPKGGPDDLPDLSESTKMFPPGPDANSSVLLPKEAPGPYKVDVIMHPVFPNRTLYVPLDVPAGIKVPIFAWENGFCYRYGRMYQAFLQEIASHGYLVIVPGEPNKLSPERTNADWQIESITQARTWAAAGTANWTAPPVTLEVNRVAIGGHGCGGDETIRNLADPEGEDVTTGIIMNFAGSASSFDDLNIPTLWIHGGQADVEDAQDDNFDYVSYMRPDLPVVELGLQTGHLGSFWSPAGGLYAETVRRWLAFQLKNSKADKDWFLGGNSSAAAKRGWSSIQTNALE